MHSEMEKVTTSSDAESLDLEAIRSRISELEEVHKSCNDDDMATSDSDELIKDCAIQLESKVDQIMAEFTDVSFLGIEDLDLYLEHLKDELSAAEAESAKISTEIELLNTTNLQDFSRLEKDLEEFKCSLDRISSEDFPLGNDRPRDACSSHGDEQSNSLHTPHDDAFEVLKLENQIEESKIKLKSLQDLDSSFKRFDALEQIEKALSGLEVTEVDGNCIKLSLKTYTPNLGDILCQQKIEGPVELSELHHEFLIEVSNETMGFKKVEMFPNDIFIGDIVDAANSFRQLFGNDKLVPETRSSLQWFILKVQDKISECNLRRHVAKSGSKSRHSFEYLDKDETIKAHLVGVDAFIKVGPGWPLTNSPLKLMSLKSSNQHKEVSLSFLCKIEERANSMDAQIRHELVSFADEIEKAVLEQMRLEIHSGNG
ncbi:hypothetical protein LINGRAHAP2_LOCUS10754 [Linum grandiflorum]